jgi:hypothetical protein
VRLSNILIDFLQSYPLQYDDTYNYLLETSSRGSFSFAFGHYIRDIIPYLVFLNNSVSKIFSFKPVGRGEAEVLDLLRRQDLQSNHIGFDSIPSKSHGTIMSHRNIQIYAIRARFIYLSLATRLRILYDLSPSRPCQYSRKICNVLVLSRQQDYPTPANSHRWGNEYEFINYSRSSLSITVVSPEKTGVTRLHNIIQTYTHDVVMSAFGSALYQIFLYPERYTEILVLMGNLNDDNIWETALYDFYPFRHMFWLFYTPANITAPVNQLFIIPPSAIVSALRCIETYKNTKQTIDIDNVYRLRPPQA